MENKIVINFAASENGIIVSDNEETYREMPLIEFNGMQPTGIIQDIYDRRAKKEMLNEIFHEKTYNKEMTDDERKELWKTLNKKIDANIYRMLRYYDSRVNTFSDERINCDKYIEIMLKDRNKEPNESKKQYKARVRKEELEELEKAGIVINYDLRGIFSNKMSIKNRFKLLIDSIKNRNISSMEFGIFTRGENPVIEEEYDFEDDIDEDAISEEEKIKKVSEKDIEAETVAEVEEFETPISASENDENVEVKEDSAEEEFEIPISVPENEKDDEIKEEPAEEEFETPISAPENKENDVGKVETIIEDKEESNTPQNGVLDSELTTEENEVETGDIGKAEVGSTIVEEIADSQKELITDKKDNEEKSLAYLMGRKTGRIIRKAKKAIEKNSEQLKKSTEQSKIKLEEQSQEVFNNTKVFKEKASRKINEIVKEGKNQLGKKYTSAKGTLDKMRAKAKDAEFRKKVAKKVATAGLLGIMVAGTLTSTIKAKDMKYEVKDNQESSSSSIVYQEENNDEKYEINIEDEQDKQEIEKRDIELKDTLTDSIEENVGIGTKVILNQGKYYASPDGCGKAYDLENFTSKYGNEFKITRINIVTAEGKNVQINLENGNGMTYSKIKEMYPDCEFVASHLASGNMQVGWTNIDMVHSILNNLDLSKDAKKVIVDNKDGKISESESQDIEQAISEALERLQENEKGEER